MKKKGFTLVELLAVIVILAIIALIATPTILSMIENSRKGAAESSLLSYVDQMEKQIVTNSMNATTAVDYNGTYTVKGATAEKSDASLNLDIKGDQPNNPGEDIIVVSNGNVTSAKLKFGTYYVAYSYKADTKDVVYCSSRDGYPEKCGDKTIPTPEATFGGTIEMVTGETYKGIAYLDPTNLSNICNASNAVSTTGTKNGCMKWYIYNDSNNAYTMILDHNTTANVVWNSEYTNTEMVEVKNQLAIDASTWDSSVKTTAKLITADDIAVITDHPTFNSATSTYEDRFYFESNNKTKPSLGVGESKYKWLFDYTYDCTDSGCDVADNSTEGYWTSSPIVDYGTCIGVCAWSVSYQGNLSSTDVDDIAYGLRPVITVSKSLLS